MSAARLEWTRAGRRIAALVLMVISAASGRGDAQQALTPAEVERRIAGTWELAEWHFEGQILTPPTVNGRWQAHDGQAMSIFNRNIGGTTWDSYSYGSYSTNEAGWTYGWERRLEVTRTAGETTARQTTIPQTLFTPRLEGANLVLDYSNGERRFVVGLNEYSFFQNGQIVRKWRRVRGGL